MLAISARHANLMCAFSMKIGGESHTRSQRSNLPDFRGDGGDVGDGDGDGDGGGGDVGGDGGDGGDSGDGGCVCVWGIHHRPHLERRSDLLKHRANVQDVLKAPRWSAMRMKIFRALRTGARFS